MGGRGSVVSSIALTHCWLLIPEVSLSTSQQSWLLEFVPIHSSHRLAGIAAEEHYSHMEHSSREECGWGSGPSEKLLSPAATALPVGSDGSSELAGNTALCTSLFSRSLTPSSSACSPSSQLCLGGWSPWAPTRVLYIRCIFPRKSSRALEHWWLCAAFEELCMIRE